MDDVLEGLDRIFPGIGVGADDGGVVDQNVDLAEAVDDGAGGGFDAVELADIAVEDLEAAGGAVPGVDGVEQLLVDVPDGDGRAAVEHALGDGEADALAGAGDDGNAAVEIVAVHVRLRG